MYNGPSGPRILLTMEISSAHAAVAANIAPTAKQIILLIFILIHDANRADDLSEVGEVFKIHGSQLQPAGRLRSIAPTCVDCVFELMFVLRAVEMPFRLRDQSVVADLPEFVAADSNAFARAARCGVGSS